MKLVAVKQLVSRGMRSFVMVLVVYGNNDNRLRAWERVE